METPFDLRITGVCLGKGAKEGERVFLVMTHEDLVDEEARTTPVCALSAGKIENAQLDLVLDEGEPVSFTVSGNATLHLTGYFVVDDDAEEGPEGFDDSSDDESFDALNASNNSDDDMIDSDDESDEPKVEEIEESILDKVRQKQAALKRKEAPAASPSPAKKKQKVVEPVSPKPEAIKVAAKPETPKKNAQPAKVETPQKTAQPAKTVTPKQSPAPKPETPKATGKETPKQSPKAQTRVQNLRGGTVAEILTPGKGSQTAAKGQKVTVKYVGKLSTNQKQFDAGKFSFKLGQGEVIKGMDVGIEGMLINEKRKLTIPANQAYGKQRMGDIPPHSDLQFEVTLLQVK